jgi:phosphate transport system protein
VPSVRRAGDDSAAAGAPDGGAAGRALRYPGRMAGRGTSTHIDRSYEAELTALRGQLLEMGVKVEQAITAAARAIFERDRAAAEQVQQRDREINRLEVEVDAMCRRILALRQPAASDLRFITTAIKIVVDLERMGDLAVNVAQRAVELADAPPLADEHELALARLAELAKAQLEKALDAFVRGDVAAAEAVMRGDELVDALYLQIFNDMVALMIGDPRNIRRGTAIMFAAKHLERFGDHATNLAEMVVYLVRGEDVRHPGSRAALAAAGR